MVTTWPGEGEEEDGRRTMPPGSVHHLNVGHVRERERGEKRGGGFPVWGLSQYRRVGMWESEPPGTVTGQAGWKLSLSLGDPDLEISIHVELCRRQQGYSLGVLGVEKGPKNRPEA